MRACGVGVVLFACGTLGSGCIRDEEPHFVIAITARYAAVVAVQDGDGPLGELNLDASGKVQLEVSDHRAARADDRWRVCSSLVSAWRSAAIAGLS